MISHKNKCIFIHLPKNAGGSIETALTGTGWVNIRDKGFKVQHEPSWSLEKRYANYWDEYFKFSFVRNPWDLVISNFVWSTHQEPNTDQLKWFILNIEDSVDSSFLDENSQATWTCQQHSFLFGPNGENHMDFIGRFENLQQDFETVCDKIAIPRQCLPHKNKSTHTHYTEYYDCEARALVAEVFAKDIEYFGYEFEGPGDREFKLDSGGTPSTDVM